MKGVMRHSKSFISRHPAIVPVLLGLAIFIVSALVLVYAIGSRDSLPATDGDLALERPEVPDEANAYIAFNAAAEACDDSSTGMELIADFGLGNPVDTNALKVVIASNDASYALLRQGTARAFCIVPHVAGVGISMPYLGHWLSLLRVFKVKGDLARSEGDYAAAAETTVALIRFGVLFQEHPETLIQYLIGRAILETGLTAAVKLAQDPEAPAEALRTVAEAVTQVPPLTDSFIRAMKAEYRLGVLGIDAVAAGTASPHMQIDPWQASLGDLLRIGVRPLPRYLIQPNRTKRLYADHIRDIIENAPRCYADMTLTPRTTPSRLGRVLHYVRPNSVGSMTLQLINPVLDAQLEKLCVSRSDLSAARIIVALHLHRRERGTFPERLDALVPDELEAIPLDPFDGKPFRYDARQGIVYSVGKNLVDDGGSAMLLKGSASDPEPYKRWNADDAVYRIK